MQHHCSNCNRNTDHQKKGKNADGKQRLKCKVCRKYNIENAVYSRRVSRRGFTGVDNRVPTNIQCPFCGARKEKICIYKYYANRISENITQYRCKSCESCFIEDKYIDNTGITNACSRTYSRRIFPTTNNRNIIDLQKIFKKIIKEYFDKKLLLDNPNDLKKNIPTYLEFIMLDHDNVAPDGNCFYQAVANVINAENHNLRETGFNDLVDLDHSGLREAASNELLNNLYLFSIFGAITNQERSRYYELLSQDGLWNNDMGDIAPYLLATALRSRIIIVQEDHDAIVDSFFASCNGSNPLNITIIYPIGFPALNRDIIIGYDGASHYFNI